jgi:hypothetical protein
MKALALLAIIASTVPLGAQQPHNSREEQNKVSGSEVRGSSPDARNGVRMSSRFSSNDCLLTVRAASATSSAKLVFCASVEAC